MTFSYISESKSTGVDSGWDTRDDEGQGGVKANSQELDRTRGIVVSLMMSKTMEFHLVWGREKTHCGLMK